MSGMHYPITDADIFRAYFFKSSMFLLSCFFLGGGTQMRLDHDRGLVCNFYTGRSYKMKRGREGLSGALHSYYTVTTTAMRTVSEVSWRGRFSCTHPLLLRAGARLCCLVGHILPLYLFFSFSCSLVLLQVWKIVRGCVWCDVAADQF